MSAGTSSALHGFAWTPLAAGLTETLALEASA
jgi:hypothetical protein